MARRWYNEDYRKIYTRQDGPWLSLPWCARALGADLIRWADERGVVAALEDGEEPESAIADVIRCKGDEREVVARAVRALLKDGYLEVRRGTVRIRNFVEAQERLSQEAARQRRKRDRDRRDAEQGTTEGVTDSVTNGVTDSVTEPVTSGVTESVTVTPYVTPSVTQKFAVSGRVESVFTHTPTTRATRSPADVLWYQGTGDVCADSPALLELRHHVDDVAERSQRDPDKLLSDAIVAYRAYRETCTVGKIPSLSPRKLLEHWPTVWERITGTAPAGRPKDASVTPIRASSQPRADGDDLWTPEELAEVEARRKLITEQRAQAVPPPSGLIPGRP